MTGLLTRVDIPVAQRQLLEDAVSIKGDPHVAFYNRNATALRDIELTREQQYLVYMNSVKKHTTKPGVNTEKT